MLYDDKPCCTFYEVFYLTHNGKILLAQLMDVLRHLRVMSNVPGKIKFPSYRLNITSTLYVPITDLFSFIMQSSFKRPDVYISPTSPHFLS